MLRNCPLVMDVVGFIPGWMVQGVERVHSEHQSNFLNMEYSAHRRIQVEGPRATERIPLHISKRSCSLLSKCRWVKPLARCLLAWIGICKNLIRPVVTLGSSRWVERVGYVEIAVSTFKAERVWV